MGAAMFDFGQANDGQRMAITTAEGPLLITAGPGTGKTFTLVQRVIYLITELGIKPEEIMVATFTEKAAKELITRISNELAARGINISLNDMYLGTFHSICLRIIKDNIDLATLARNYRIADNFDQKYLVFRQINRFRNLPHFSSFPSPRGAWNQAATICKLADVLAEELIDFNCLLSSDDEEIVAIGEASTAYFEALSHENWLDFTSIQVEAYRLLTEHPELADELSHKLRYIMVDEYQDTNYIQERLTFLLGQAHRNICVVGDDDQGLYRFRGATIRNILEFPSMFPEGTCKVVPLDLNYRSDPTIIDFYNTWMTTTEGDKFCFDWDRFRYPKRIKATRTPCKVVDTVVRLTVTAGMDDWEERIYQFIRTLAAGGKITDYNQVAILFRSVKSRQARSLADYLEAKGISTYSPRSDAFFDRDEIRLLLGMLLLMFPRFVVALEHGEIKFMHEDYARYLIGCITSANEHFRTSGDDFLKAFVASTGKQHLALTGNAATDYGFTGLVYQLFAYEPFRSIVDTDLSLGVKDQRAVRNLSLFVQLLAKYEYLHRVNILTAKQIDKEAELLFNMYLYYLWHGGMDEYEDETEYLPSGCVPFLTIHQSKGMEFPIVIVDTTNATPRASADRKIQAIKDEYGGRSEFEPLNEIKYFDFWRLYYTAFSRARNLLILTSSVDKEHQGKCFDAIYEGLSECDPRSCLIDAFAVDDVRESEIKPSFSFTGHVTLYEGCPRQYKYYRELEFPQVRVGATLFGNLVHQTIEDINNAAIRGDVSDITPQNIGSWLQANYESLSKAQHSYLSETVRNAALRHVTHYIEYQSDRWDRLKEAEVPVDLVKDDYIIEGKVDLIQGDDGTLELVDFKAERKPDLYKDHDRLERYHEQLLLYAHLIEQRTGQQISKMHLYYTGEESGVPTITYRRDGRSIDRIAIEFDSTVRKIMNKDFEHRASKPRLCENCDFRHHCNS